MGAFWDAVWVVFCVNVLLVSYHAACNVVRFGCVLECVWYRVLERILGTTMYIGKTVF